MIPPDPIRCALGGAALYARLWLGLCQALAAPWLLPWSPAVAPAPAPPQPAPEPPVAAVPPPPPRRPHLRLVASRD